MSAKISKRKIKQILLIVFFFFQWRNNGVITDFQFGRTIPLINNVWIKNYWSSPYTLSLLLSFICTFLWFLSTQIRLSALCQENLPSIQITQPDRQRASHTHNQFKDFYIHQYSQMHSMCNLLSYCFFKKSIRSTNPIFFKIKHYHKT